MRTFCGQGERGSIFRDFVRTSFIDGPFCIEAAGEKLLKTVPLA